MTTHSMSKRSLKVSNIGPAENTKCLMVKIDWTSAKVAHIRANKTFKMQVEQVSLVREVYTFIQTLEITIHEGQHIYFTQSKRGNGYYYLNASNNNAVSSVGCTCVASTHFHQMCSHKLHIAESTTFGRKLDAVRKPAVEKECARCYQPTSDYVVRDRDNICTACIQALEAEYAAREVQAAISTGVEVLREKLNTMSVGITPEMGREERAAAWTKWAKQQRSLKKQVRELAIAS